MPCHTIEPGWNNLTLVDIQVGTLFSVFHIALCVLISSVPLFSLIPSDAGTTSNEEGLNKSIDLGLLAVVTEKKSGLSNILFCNFSDQLYCHLLDSLIDSLVMTENSKADNLVFYLSNIDRFIILGDEYYIY